ncbi:MAG: thiosulfate oxidation carrier protein SoxY [Geminicoccaceae bacterium]
MNSSLSRRHLLGVAGAGAASAGFALVVTPVKATETDAHAYLAELAGSGDWADDGIVSLDTPEIAENGNTVPVGVMVDSPMTEDNYVKAVHLAADGNPSPQVASFFFTPQCGECAASTRIRLAQTQNLVAVAELSDGSLHTVARQVKVTIGGCGG